MRKDGIEPIFLFLFSEGTSSEFSLNSEFSFKGEEETAEITETAYFIIYY